MFVIKKFLAYITLTFYAFNAYTQTIELKLPLNQSVYTIYSDSAYFLWEDSSQNTWQLDLALDSNFNSFTSYITPQNKYSLDINTLTNNTFFWRIRSLTDTSELRKFTIIDIDSLGTLIYHINTQQGLLSNNNLLYQWNNLANFQFNAIQIDTTKQPQIEENIIHGKSMIKFGGNNGNTKSNLMLNEFLLPDNNFTFFSCSKQISLNSSLSYILGSGTPPNGLYSGGTAAGGRNFGILSNNGTGNNSIRVSGITKLDFEIRSANYNKLFINSFLQPTINNGLVTQLKFNTVGLRPDQPALNFHGYLGDIIIYNEILSDSSRLLVENYLKTKYTPFPDLGKDSIVCNYEFKIGFRTDHGYSQIDWSTGDTNVDSIVVSNSGKYWVTVKSFGISLTDTININLSTKPTLNYTTNQIRCVNDSFYLTNDSLGPFIYTWSNGSTDDTLFNLSSGEYFISQNDTAKNCIITSDTISILIDSFSINSSLGADRVFCLGSSLEIETSSTNNEPYIYNWSTGDTTESIILNTTGDTTIFVEITDAFDCVLRDTILAEISTTSVPIVDFISDTVCFGSISNLSNTSTPSGADVINSYNWIFPDNTNFSGGPTVQFTNPNENTFEVTLEITTDSSCENSITKPVYLHPLPVVAFAQDIFCSEDSVTIDNNSSVNIPDSIINYSWYSNSILVNNSENPKIYFASEGFYELKLEVETKFGCLNSFIDTIEVFPALSADFSFHNNCIGDSVSFIDETPSFSVVDWDWNFNGSGSSSLQNPKFVFNTIGSQNISLNIENAIGCKSTITKSVNIVSQPVASFNYDKTCLNDYTLFFDNSSVLNDSIITYTWQIDTFNYSGDSVSHLFVELALYNTSLEIETKNGCTDDTISFVTIHDNPNPSFEFSPNYGTAPLEVQFTNLTTDASLFNWDFGDTSGLSTDANPNYTYLQNGIYNISLAATNSFNCNASISQQISIIPSDLDIELKNLSFDIIENTNNSFSIKPKLEIRNAGTRLIQNADLVLSLDTENKFAQYWESELEIGSAINYSFDSYFLISSIEKSNYICVEAINVNDNTELNFANNKVCSLLDGLIQFSQVYPNPAEDAIFLDIITADKGKCSVQVFDITGKSIVQKQDIQLVEGYNKLHINTSVYQSGKYIIMLNYLDENYSRWFLIK